VNAVAEIVILPVLRPGYDNRRLARPRDWFADNKRALSEFWWALSQTDEPSDVPYSTWAAIQHETQVMLEQAE
jgi:hypothetical protein